MLVAHHVISMSLQVSHRGYPCFLRVLLILFVYPIRFTLHTVQKILYWKHFPFRINGHMRNVGYIRQEGLAVIFKMYRLMK